MAEKLRETVEEYQYNNLFAGTGFPAQVGSVNLLSGQGVLQQGSVIGINVAGEGKLMDGTAGFVADSVLTDAFDTGLEVANPPVTATVYVSGLFNRKALIVGGAETVEKHEITLKTKGIYLKDNI